MCSLLSDKEQIQCEYCGKETIVRKDMAYWLRLSAVRAEEECNEVYFCSYLCLKSWARETSESFLERDKAREIMRGDVEFDIEKLLAQSKLLDKVVEHEDPEFCPLCEQRFGEGLVEFIHDKPIHSRCIEQLRIAQRER